MSILKKYGKIPKNLIPNGENDYISKIDFVSRLDTQEKIILHDHHDSLIGGHRGEKKTLLLIKKQFYWPTMRKDVKAYVLSWPRCKESKASNQKKLGLLRPFPPPERK